MLNQSQLFLTSPRNSPAAHRGLFEALDCQILVTTDPAPPSVQTIVDAVQPRQLIIPSEHDLLSETHTPVDYKQSFEEGLKDPLWVMYVVATPLPISLRSHSG